MCVDDCRIREFFPFLESLTGALGGPNTSERRCIPELKYLKFLEFSLSMSSDLKEVVCENLLKLESFSVKVPFNAVGGDDRSERTKLVLQNLPMLRTLCTQLPKYNVEFCVEETIRNSLCNLSFCSLELFSGLEVNEMRGLKNFEWGVPPPGSASNIIPLPDIRIANPAFESVVFRGAVAFRDPVLSSLTLENMPNLTKIHFDQAGGILHPQSAFTMNNLPNIRSFHFDTLSYRVGDVYTLTIDCVWDKLRNFVVLNCGVVTFPNLALCKELRTLRIGTRVVTSSSIPQRHTNGVPLRKFTPRMFQNRYGITGIRPFPLLEHCELHNVDGGVCLNGGSNLETLGITDIGRSFGGLNSHRMPKLSDLQLESTYNARCMSLILSSLETLTSFSLCFTRPMPRNARLIGGEEQLEDFLVTRDEERAQMILRASHIPNLVTLKVQCLNANEPMLDKVNIYGAPKLAFLTLDNVADVTLGNCYRLLKIMTVRCTRLTIFNCEKLKILNCSYASLQHVELDDCVKASLQRLVIGNLEYPNLSNPNHPTQIIDGFLRLETLVLRRYAIAGLKNLPLLHSLVFSSNMIRTFQLNNLVSLRNLTFVNDLPEDTTDNTGNWRRRVTIELESMPSLERVEWSGNDVSVRVDEVSKNLKCFGEILRRRRIALFLDNSTHSGVLKELHSDCRLSMLSCAQRRRIRFPQLGI